MRLKRTDEFRKDAVQISLTSGHMRTQVVDGLCVRCRQVIKKQSAGQRLLYPTRATFWITQAFRTKHIGQNIHEVFIIKSDTSNSLAICTRDLMLKYDRKRIRLELDDRSRGFGGKFFGIYVYGCGRIHVRAKGVTLPS
jgi:hypothetical protein